MSRYDQAKKTKVYLDLLKIVDCILNGRVRTCAPVTVMTVLPRLQQNTFTRTYYAKQEKHDNREPSLLKEEFRCWEEL